MSNLFVRVSKMVEFITQPPKKGGCASGNSAKVQELTVELGYDIITLLMQRRFEDTNKYSLKKTAMEDIIFNSKISNGKIAKEVVNEASYICNIVLKLLQKVDKINIKHAGKKFASLFNIKDMNLGHLRGLVFAVLFQIDKHDHKKFCTKKQKLFVIEDRVKWLTKFSEQIKKLTPKTKSDGTLEKVAAWEEIEQIVKGVGKKADECKPHYTFNFWADSLQAHQFRSGTSKISGGDETFWRLGLYEMIQEFFIPNTKDELDEWGIIVRSKDRGKNNMSKKELVQILELQNHTCFFTGEVLTLDNSSDWHIGHDEKPWAGGGDLTVSNSYAVHPSCNSNKAETFTVLWEKVHGEKGVILKEARERCIAQAV